MTPLQDIDVVILAGGLGTRIADTLGDTPKVLAPINGRPFLDHLLHHLRDFGFSHFHLSLGHLADKVIDHLTVNGRAPSDVEWVVEPKPQGTAGALRFIAKMLSSDPVLVLNGDTWFDTDLTEFIHQHIREDREASILCTTVPDGSRYGRVEVNEVGNVLRFIEKEEQFIGSCMINAGTYLLSQKMIQNIVDGNEISLEKIFLQILPSKSVWAHLGDGTFIDIGTPDSLIEAKNHIGIVEKGTPA
ncbi:MAG: NTP transferase domain-containing protein [Rhodospirillales bacterium]|jgi:mannose-1-phosphate guanylyltransferase|nr:NTP transferase domain-containing protein [Rhodospirillales bacterium]MBT3906933.1 NTP transferase domain-containing protein [Rhodospirillaceae bacterium]MBT6220918.1 NTP transferase domain-containing protein [Rhodospirillaceae bacterium]MBT6360761.1 NTP transferase domain-containing protein [Rhodospirillaceae bacterium]MBT7485998.1 NTP transferase domain-containing protein [Rhodospirillales bacterium]